MDPQVPLANVEFADHYVGPGRRRDHGRGEMSIG
jgi:hypothetical protein